jgi:hypothetical protein
VEVVSFGKSSSSKLVEAADDFLDLDESPKKYLIGYDNHHNRRSEYPRPLRNTQEQDSAQ